MATRLLDQQIRELAEARGFKIELPWQRAPWDCGVDVHPPGSGGAEGWAEAQRLRRELIAEIKAAHPPETTPKPSDKLPRRQTTSRRTKKLSPGVGRMNGQ
jgi:hypothetical protein